MKQLQPTEYMYASARIRSQEKYLVGRERLDVLAEAPTGREVMERLAEYGLTPPEVEDGTGATDRGPLTDSEAMSLAREGMLLAILRNAYREVETAVPDPTVFRYFRYPYDANNLKAAVKCAIRGISAADMLFDFGTVPADRVEALVRDGDLRDFPPAMAAATPRAREAYDRTGDPREIDVILDRACFSDMLDAVTATGETTLIGWLRARIDLTNILICLRILRMKQGEAARPFLASALLPGGTLEESFFLDAYAGGEGGLWDALVPTPYAVLGRVEGEVRPLSLVERAADDCHMNLVRDGARVPFGAPVVGGYLYGCETAVKNLRILLAAKDAGLSPDTLRERMRVSYV